jgi:hypothetical protein
MDYTTNARNLIQDEEGTPIGELSHVSVSHLADGRCFLEIGGTVRGVRWSSRMPIAAGWRLVRADMGSVPEDHLALGVPDVPSAHGDGSVRGGGGDQDGEGSRPAPSGP